MHRGDSLLLTVLRTHKCVNARRLPRRRLRARAEGIAVGNIPDDCRIRERTGPPIGGDALVDNEPAQTWVAGKVLIRLGG
jgi:hypothetical protein